jgi:hypothetical protein
VTFFTPTFYTWVPVLLIAGALPLICYSDIKRRSIPDWYFTFIGTAGAIITIIQYLVFNVYGYEELVITALLVLMYWALMRLPFTGDYFHGDDMILMWMISIFCVVNPLHPDSGDLAVTVMIYLVPVMCSIFAFLFTIEFWKAKIGTPVEEIALNVGRNFPMVVPIAIAFYLAVLI